MLESVLDWERIVRATIIAIALHVIDQVLIVLFVGVSVRVLVTHAGGGFIRTLCDVQSLCADAVWKSVEVCFVVFGCHGCVCL